jgi:hypothetical protein
MRQQESANVGKLRRWSDGLLTLTRWSPYGMNFVRLTGQLVRAKPGRYVDAIDPRLSFIQPSVYKLAKICLVPCPMPRAEFAKYAPEEGVRAVYEPPW